MLRVNNSLVVALLRFFLASQLTIMSLDLQMENQVFFYKQDWSPQELCNAQTRILSLMIHNWMRHCHYAWINIPSLTQVLLTYEGLSILYFITSQWE